MKISRRSLVKSILVLLSILFTPYCYSQSLKDLLNKENVSKITSSITNAGSLDIVGTWKYTGSAVEFESGNLLKKAGGSVASSTAEKKLDEQLTKLGIQADQASFVFNKDNTFTVVTSKKNISGTYTLNSETKKIELVFAAGKKFETTVEQSGNTLSLLFDADKMLQLLSYIGSKSSNTTLKSVSSLADSYDGMMMGLKLEKQ